MAETLLPCPFCGGEATIEREGTPRQSCNVACTECGARLESGETFNSGSSWNRRAAPREPSPEAINAASRVTGAWIGDADDPLALDEVKRIPAMLRAAYAVDFPAAPRPDAGDGTGEP